MRRLQYCIIYQIYRRIIFQYLNDLCGNYKSTRANTLNINTIKNIITKKVKDPIAKSIVYYLNKIQKFELRKKAKEQ